MFQFKDISDVIVVWKKFELETLSSALYILFLDVFNIDGIKFYRTIRFLVFYV